MRREASIVAKRIGEVGKGCKRLLQAAGSSILNFIEEE
jgi:hypothetical protein